jgi:hypothetical protein
VEGEEEGRGLRREGQNPALVGCLGMWIEIRKREKRKKKKKKKGGVQGGNELTKMNEISDNCGYFIIIHVLVFDHFRHWKGQGLGTVQKLIDWMAKVYLGIMNGFLPM